MRKKDPVLDGLITIVTLASCALAVTVIRVVYHSPTRLLTFIQRRLTLSDVFQAISWIVPRKNKSLTCWVRNHKGPTV
jgi:hypothetical protein